MKLSILIANLNQVMDTEGDVEITAQDWDEMDGPDIRIVKSVNSGVAEYTLWGGVNPDKPFFSQP